MSIFGFIHHSSGGRLNISPESPMNLEWPRWEGRRTENTTGFYAVSCLTDGWSLGTFRSQSEQLVRLGLRESAYKYRLPFPFSIFIDCHLLPASVLLLLYLLKAV